MIVTLDGPAGAGKSTAARAVAARLGWQYLDTGAMYRAVAWAARERGVDVTDQFATARLAEEIRIEFTDGGVRVDGVDVTEAIRTKEVTEATRHVADTPAVREVMTGLQRRIAAGADVITEGRDQGTVVFPRAELKVFLTASPYERARRRQGEERGRGREVSLDDVLAAQSNRDEADRRREVGPLVPAADAVHLETDGLSHEQVVDRIVLLVRKAQSAAAGEKTPSKPIEKHTSVKGSIGGQTFFGRLLYTVLWWLSRTLAIALFGFRVRFAERVPDTGGLLVLSSHQSHLDPLLLGLACQRRLSSVARSSLYAWGPFGAAIAALGAIPIDRDAPSIASIKTVIAALKRGIALMVFPEGTRTSDGRLAPLKPGFIVLARRSGVPILPVAIVGAWECWPKGSLLPRPGRIRLEFGRLMHPEQIARLDDATLLAECADHLAALDAEARRFIHPRRPGPTVRGPA